MTRTVHVATAAAGLALFTFPVFLPGAAADTSPSRTKAQIEHAEHAATGPTDLTKAQIEHAEHTATGPTDPTKAQVEQRKRQQGLSGAGQGTAPSTPVSSGTGDAAAWQLALSAALGATLMGGIVLVSRQVSQHRQAVAQ
jgi:hypothetical protein